MPVFRFAYFPLQILSSALTLKYILIYLTINKPTEDCTCIRTRAWRISYTILIGIFDGSWTGSRHSGWRGGYKSRGFRSEPATRYRKVYHLRGKHRFFIESKKKKCLLESAVYALYECLNPTFLGGELPELSFNQFLQVLCINCLRMKEIPRYRL